MQTITFYSYKGGVGRTLALAHFAHYLALLGQKVVAIDFDLEAPGLHYKLFPVDPKKSFSPGLVDYVSDQISAQGADRPVADYVVKVNTLPGASGEIRFLPTGGAPHPDYWAKFSSIDWNDLIYGDAATGTIMFLELKEKLREAFQPDFLLIDARTGITEIGGVATSLLADKLVCLLTPSLESLEGSRVVLRALSRSLRPPGAGKLQIVPVLSRLPVRDRGAERKVVDRVRDFLNEPAEDLTETLEFGEILLLHHEALLSDAERILIGQNDGAEAGRLPRDYLRLFARLSGGLVLRQAEPTFERQLRLLLDSTEETRESILADMAIAGRLAARDPDNAAWQRDLSVSHERLGDVQVAQGDLSGALESHRAAMAIRERLAARDPDNTVWQRDLSVAHARVAEVSLRLHNTADAREMAAKALAKARENATRFPKDRRIAADIPGFEDLARRAGVLPP